MERIKEEILQKKGLTDEQKTAFANDISSKFSQWDDDRQAQVADARMIMDEVYMHYPFASKQDEEDAWKANIKLNKLRSIKQAKKAAMWREIWSNPSQMFNVRGTDEKTEQNAQLQKTAIVDSLEKMKIGKTFDDGIENLLDIGELVFITDWEERTKVIKRRSKDGFIIETLKRFLKLPGQVNNKLFELPYYENARVKSISPFMFVFDHNYYDYVSKKSWDSCIKIYKRFEAYENIVNNKDYELSQEAREYIKGACSNTKLSEGNKAAVDLREENVYGQKVEVLYCHGDFKIDGELYKNYIAEIVAGKYVVRFEENPLFINPFIWCAIEIDPLTGRGIPQLKSAYYLAKEQEKMSNAAIDMQQLALNPPTWVDETFVDKSKNVIKIAPGKLFKYKNGWSGNFPKVIELGYSNNLFTFIDSIDQTISDVTNVNSNMFGNVTATKRTATELSLVDKGATATIAKELDIISENATIPMIENVAELLAMFKFGEEKIFVKEKGLNVVKIITDEIRQAQYNYIYDDRNAINDQKSRFNEVFQLLKSVAQDPELHGLIDWKTSIKKAIEMTGFDNPDMFFVPETPLAKVFGELKTLPEEVQNRFAGIISSQIQQVMQFSGQYQNTSGQETVQQNVFPQQEQFDGYEEDATPL